MILSVFILNCQTLFYPITIEKKEVVDWKHTDPYNEIVKALLLQYANDIEYELKLIKKIYDLNGKRIWVTFEDPELKKLMQRINK